MPLDNYIAIKVGGDRLVYKDPESLPLSISYELEDSNNFQEKGSSTALEIEIPATPEMDRVANTFHNPGIDDLTEGEVFRNPRPATIEANGVELLIGKAILNNATHTDKPESYTYDFFGDNGDWVIDLKETTLFDLLKHITFPLTKAHIESTWDFNGRDEEMPYVFAPVRYGRPMGGYKFVRGERIPVNNNVEPIYLRPSLSVYWIIYWAFKSIGYRVTSEFFETDYFQRMVLPWTFGNFLGSEGTKYDIHKFRARSLLETYYFSSGGSGYLDLQISNDSEDGMFDNNNTIPGGDYSYSSGGREGTWEYKTPHYGTLEATFSNSVYVEAFANQNSSVTVYVEWYKNGVLEVIDRVLYVETSAGVGTGRNDAGIKESFYTTSVSPGDKVSSKVRYNIFESKMGDTELKIAVVALQLDYFKIPLGGTISFDAYLGLKKIKFLDLLRGITDTFNLIPKARPEIKTVYFEPAHPYYLSDDPTDVMPGYFNGNWVDWSGKQDLSKKSTVSLYKDHDRELILRFKEDSNYGTLKILQDRHLVTLGAAKYVLPDRFKQGKREIENRFFTPVVHVDIDEWASISGVAPQVVALVPENISNTSASEAENTFGPKLCWYKGLTSGYGWKWDGVESTQWPFMFAVNYKDKGYEDPVLSYSNEQINGVLGIGLMQRFFLQRFANMRGGVNYSTWNRLKNYEVADPLHREHKVLRGQKWELVSIDDYRPLAEQSTKTELRKHTPVSSKDRDNTFPSESSIIDGDLTDDKFDMKYQQMKCLFTDIPRI